MAKLFHEPLLATSNANTNAILTFGFYFVAFSVALDVVCIQLQAWRSSILQQYKGHVVTYRHRQIYLFPTLAVVSLFLVVNFLKFEYRSMLFRDLTDLAEAHAEEAQDFWDDFFEKGGKSKA